MTKLAAHDSLANTYWYKKDDESEVLLTLNFTPGQKAYDEKVMEFGGQEYRVWNPYRSKLAAAVIKKLQNIPITAQSHILYLGAASGTTCSHISDLLRDQGKVYCIEFSSRVIRELVRVCEIRKNLIPILGDARYPHQYRMLIPEQVDVIYADVAQPEQAQLIIANAETFLKSNGWILLFVKSRSIDVTMDPEQVYKDQVKILKNAQFKIVELTFLSPYSEDHALIVAQWLK